MATGQYMGLPVEYLGAEPNNLGDMVTDPAEQRRNQAIYNYFKKNPKASRNTYGLGARLPSISGLRLRRKVKTRFGIRDVITDGSGMIFGYANPAAQLAIGKAGPAGSQYVGLTRRGRKPGTPATPPVPGTGGGATTGGAVGDGTSNLPGGDDYTGYGDYPMIATYLRGLQNQEKNFNETWKTNILPGVSSGLQNIANVGANIAAQYGGAVGTGTTPGYVTNAYNVSSAIAPQQVAGGLGGVTQTYNPTALRAAMGASASAGASAAADAKYNALTAAATPVSATQGILANLTSKAATISQSYADKRLTERLRLDQWIQEQKTAAAELKNKTDYNAALMKMSGLELDEKIRSNKADEAVAQTNAETARINANNAGQKTDAQMAAAGFIKVPSTKLGAKSQAIIDKTSVTSKSGQAWYKPVGSVTSKQAESVKKARDLVTESYYGEKYDPVTGTLTPGTGGINRAATPREQGIRIATLVKSMIDTGEIPKSWVTEGNIKRFVSAALAKGRTFGEDQTAMTDKQFSALIQWVVRSLRTQ